MTARILVVDDIPANVKLLEARLVAEYFDVLTAADGYEALAICEKQPLDLILLDIMMPGMDGKETLRKLAAQTATAGIPVIFMTARGTDQNELMAFGAAGVISKPFDVMSLSTQIRTILEGRRPV